MENILPMLCVKPGYEEKIEISRKKVMTSGLLATDLVYVGVEGSG